MNHLIFFEDVFPSEKSEIQLLELCGCLRSRFCGFNIFLGFFSFGLVAQTAPPRKKKCHPFQKVKLFRYSLATKGSEKSLNQRLDEVIESLLPWK